MTPNPGQTKESPSAKRTAAVTLAVAVLVAGVALMGFRAFGGGDDTPTSAAPAAPAAATLSSGPVAGVAVAIPSVDLGPVPLNKDVVQTFTLKNSGTGKAQLGKPRIETLEGC